MSPISPRVSGLLLLLFTCLPFQTSHAQEEKKETPAFRADYSAESFVIEKSTTRWSFENDGTGTRETTATVRIQSDAGIQHFGVLEFSYQKAFESVEIRYVKVRKPDGSVVETPLDEVQDVAAAITREAPFYSDLREKHLPVKGLRSGDVLDFQCAWHQTKALVPGQFWASYEYDDDSIILNEIVEIVVPRDREVKFKSAIAPAIADAGGRRIYTWMRSNLVRKTPSKVETGQLAVRGRLPAPEIQLSSFKSWQEIARWYDELQRERVRPTPEIREKAAELTRNAASDAAKLDAIYRYVSTEFRYIGVAFGIGRYQPHTAVEVLNNQYGDCKDKHTLLASLLAAAGIPSYPALINSSHVLEAEVPSPAQFDHLITLVPQGKEKIWLDSTQEVAPFAYLIPVLRAKPALVVLPDSPAMETTPADPPFPTSWIFKINAKLDDSGTLEGKVEQTLRGDMEVPMRAGFRAISRADWKEVVQQFSYLIGFGGEVSDVVVSAPEATSKPLTFSYTYKRKDYSDWKGRRISPPAPNAIGVPFEEKGELPSTLWLGAPGEFQFDSRVELPSGWTPRPPPNKDIVWDKVAYHASYATEGNVLIARYRVVQTGREVNGAEVRDYKAFAEKVQADRNQYIPLASGAETVEQAQFNLQNQIWSLPDSTDEKALAAESDARAALQQGSIQAAIEGFKRAVALDSKFTRAWVLLGQLYMGFRQREAAEDALRNAIESDPQQPVPYKLLAFALTAVGKTSAAMEVWEDLAKVSPEDRDFPTNMASLLMGDERYADAVPYLEKSVKLYPKSSLYRRRLVTAYLNDNQDEKAQSAIEELFKVDQSPGTKNDVAYQLADMNKRLPEALRWAQEAVQEEEKLSSAVHLEKLSAEDLRLTPAVAAFWDTLGWAHFRLGTLKEAESYLHAAWTVQQDPVIGNHLGEVYEAQKRTQDAIRIYNLVLGGRSATDEGQRALRKAEAARNRLRKTIPNSQRQPDSVSSAGEELSLERTVRLPKLISGHANAEFFVLLGPGPSVVETKFISGSELLKSAGKALAEARFKVSFPEKSAARLVRRGILACYPNSGCSFVLFPTDMVRTVE